MPKNVMSPPPRTVSPGATSWTLRGSGGAPATAPPGEVTAVLTAEVPAAPSAEVAAHACARPGAYTSVHATASAPSARSRACALHRDERVLAHIGGSRIEAGGAIREV